MDSQLEAWKGSKVEPLSNSKHRSKVLSSPDVWGAVKLFSILFKHQSLFHWSKEGLSFNRNKLSVGLWYLSIATGVFSFGLCLTFAVLTRELIAETRQVPTLLLMIDTVAFVCCFNACLQVFFKIESGEDFVLGFNQVLYLQHSIYKKFSNQVFELALDLHRKKQYKILNEQYLLPSIAGTPPGAVLIVIGIVYFNMDPPPVLLASYPSLIYWNVAVDSGGSQPILYILATVYRYVNVSILGYECARLCIEILLIAIFLFQTYEFILAFLGKVRSPVLYFTYYMRLQICHNAIKEYINSMFVLTFLFGQVGIVVFLWITIRSFEILPFVLFICCPVFVLSLGGMVYVLIDFLGAILPKQSQSLIRFWSHPNPKIFGNCRIMTLRSIRKRGVSQRKMIFKCGPFFKIGKETTLAFLNTVLGNLATAVILIEL